MAVKRKYESERRTQKEQEKGNDVKSQRVKKARYDQRKLRVSAVVLLTKALLSNYFRNITEGEV